MVDISTSSKIENHERIKNIHTFLQAGNPLALSEDVAKSILALEEACGELTSTEQMKQAQAKSSPMLNRPKAMPLRAKTAQGEKAFNANAVLVETFSTIRQLLHEGNIGELSNRLQLLNMESESLRNQGNTLLDVFKKNTEKLGGIKDKLASQQDEDAVLRAKFDALNQQLDAFQKPIEQNEAQQQSVHAKLKEVDDLMTLVPSPAIDPEDQDTENKLLETKKILTSQLDQLTTENKTLLSDKQTISHQAANVNQQISLLNTEILKTSDLAVEQAKVAKADSDNLNSFIEAAPRRTEVDGEKWENTLAILTMLTAQLKKAMGEDSIRNMKEQEEVMLKINEASRKDSDKKAKEAAESERKAAESNKAASCASKIFSYVLLAVSVIATVASFGTAAPLTLAIAAIGIAMSVADIVLEETGHGSLMQMLANEISSVVTDMLISFGVDEDKAKQIGSIVGMIVAAIAFLAVSLLSMGSMIKNLVGTVKNAAQLLLKNVGSLLKNTIKAMPKSLTNALGNIATKTAKVTDSAAESADSMGKLSQLAKLSDKFDDASNAIKGFNQVATKVDKSSEFVSLGGQMVKVSDSVADSADSMVKLTKFTKLADKFDDVSDIAKGFNQVAAKVDKSSDFISLGGQMVKVSDSVADSADSMVKLTKFTKLADKFDDVKGVSKSLSQATNKMDDVSEAVSSSEKLTNGVKSQSATMARVDVGMKTAGAGLTVANAATTGGLRLSAAAYIRDMKEMLAGMMLNNEAIQSLTELLNALIKAMSKNNEQFDEMFTGMMTSLKQSGDNKVDMLKTARFA
ncbi:type III secretion system translocon subunit SctE [Providencia sp. Me31A]|uniref:type III secretion system translocon subunit SctE n=1 Tax=Providencia sp. Me31A TaxID=3392637 RepID=UPI003D2E321C